MQFSSAATSSHNLLGPLNVQSKRLLHVMQILMQPILKDNFNFKGDVQSNGELSCDEEGAFLYSHIWRRTHFIQLILSPASLIVFICVLFYSAYLEYIAVLQKKVSEPQHVRLKYV